MSISCDEYATVWSERVRKARKEHECTACAATILPGQRYVYVTSLYDGRWTVEAVRCMRCELIYKHLISLPTEYDEAIDPNLACGHEYTRRWGREPPPEIAALAFMTPGEVQALEGS